MQRSENDAPDGTGLEFPAPVAFREPPVLVVDDDPQGATMTTSILAEGGFRVVGEARGDSVLRLVREAVMRLVVSELYIPSAEGHCVVHALKSDRARLPRLRVLVHTRYTTDADMEFALSAGADAVVLKPSRADVLLREVRRLDGERDAAA
jgi:CheY-like chemotaxis protein